MPGEFVIPIVAIVMFHLSVIVFVVIYFSTRHKERMALLEYDRDASVFHRQRLPGSGLLKWGLVLAFSGAGLLSGYMLEMIFDINEEVAYFSCIFMGAGLGLITFYRIANQKLKRANSVL